MKAKGKLTMKQLLAVIVALLLITAANMVLESQGLPSLSELVEILAGETQPAPALPAEGTLEVHILDVGQADCILIRGSEKTILVDAGTSDSAVSILGYLKDLGITKLDMIINTHPHNDHFGGMRSVMEGMETGEVLMTPLTGDLIPTTVSYEKLITYLADNKISTKEAVAGTAYQLGGGGVLTILGPQTAFKDLNSSSIVCRVDFGESSFLLTGDMETVTEKDLLARDATVAADVLKAAHHGSRTSSSKDFLEEVNPRYVAISCGKGNDYGHPHKEVLERYEALGCEIYRTDLDGAIVFATDGETLSVSTQAGGQKKAA